MTDFIRLLPDWFLGTYIFLIGICVGSFLNVAVLRGLNGEDIVFGHSHCPKCNKNLKWYMNIPLFSYIFLRGKCAYCGSKISIQYFTVELLSGLLFLYTFYSFGISKKTVLVCAILSLFIVLALSDILETVIIDYHAYILFFVCILALYFGIFNYYPIHQALFFSFLIFILFEYISLVSLSLIGSRCFGFGDSLILLGLCLIISPKTIPLFLFMSFLVQIILSLFPIFKNKNYKLFCMMSILLILLMFDGLIFYFNSHLMKYVFWISILLMVIVLLFSMFDIYKKSKVQNQVAQKTDDTEDKPISLFNIVFVFLFISKELFKNKYKSASFAYFLYLPVLITSGIVVFGIQNALLTKLATVLYIVLFCFVYIISSYENNAEMLLLGDLNNNEADDNDNVTDENNDSGNLFTMLPFGPALLITASAFIFYSDNIKLFFETIYNNYNQYLINIF